MICWGINCANPVLDCLYLLVSVCVKWQDDVIVNSWQLEYCPSFVVHGLGISMSKL